MIEQRLKPKIAPLIFVVLFSLPFQVAAQPQQRVASAGNATISGRVVLKGEPARNVLVYLQPQQGPAPSNPEAVQRARTGEGGQFRIAGVAAGVYQVIALAPGFVSSDPIRAPGKTINLSEGENVENIEIELKQGGVITGRVTNSRSLPLADERVMLTKIDKNGRPQTYLHFGSNSGIYQTDDRGIYRIYGLPEGRYLVSVGAKQSASTGAVGASFYPRTYHPDAANETDARVIEVADGSENTNVDITVPDAIRTRTISGRVVNGVTGHPVAGVEITWGVMHDFGKIGLPGLFSGDRSRVDGVFHLRGMTPGKYAVFPRPSTDNEFFGEPVICDLSNGDAGGVEVKLRPGGSVSGFVVIEGTNDPKALANLTPLSLYVSFSPTQLAAPRSDHPKINPDGTFLVRGLPPGSARINYTQRREDRSLALARIEHNGAPVREGIKVGAGEQVSGVLVVLTDKTFALRGELKISGDVLPAGIRLYANVKRMDQTQQPSSFSGGEVDARGQFVINGLTTGEYELTVGPIWYEGADPVDPRVEKAFRLAKQRILVDNDAQRVMFMVDLSRKE